MKKLFKIFQISFFILSFLGQQCCAMDLDPDEFNHIRFLLTTGDSQSQSFQQQIAYQQLQAWLKQNSGQSTRSDGFSSHCFPGAQLGASSTQPDIHFMTGGGAVATTRNSSGLYEHREVVIRDGKIVYDHNGNPTYTGKMISSYNKSPEKAMALIAQAQRELDAQKLDSVYIQRQEQQDLAMQESKWHRKSAEQSATDHLAKPQQKQYVQDSSQWLEHDDANNRVLNEKISQPGADVIGELQTDLTHDVATLEHETKVADQAAKAIEKEIHMLQKKIAELDEQLKGWFTEKDEARSLRSKLEGELICKRKQLLNHKIKSAVRQEYLQRKIQEKQARIERTKQALEDAQKVSAQDIDQHVSALKERSQEEHRALRISQDQLNDKKQRYAKAAKNPRALHKAFKAVCDQEAKHAQQLSRVHEVDATCRIFQERQASIHAQQKANLAKADYPVVDYIKSALKVAHIDEKWAKDKIPQALAHVSQIYNQGVDAQDQRIKELGARSSGQITLLSNPAEFLDAVSCASEMYNRAGHRGFKLPTEKETWKNILIGVSQGTYNVLNLPETGERILKNTVDGTEQILEVVTSGAIAAVEKTSYLTVRAVDKLSDAMDCYMNGDYEGGNKIMQEFSTKLKEFGVAATELCLQTTGNLANSIKTTIDNTPTRDLARDITQGVGDAAITIAAGNVVFPSATKVASQIVGEASEVLAGSSKISVIEGAAQVTSAGKAIDTAKSIGTLATATAEVSGASVRTAGEVTDKTTKVTGAAEKAVEKTAVPVAGTLTTETETAAAVKPTVKIPQSKPSAANLVNKGKGAAETSAARGSQPGYMRDTVASKAKRVGQRKLITTRESWKHTILGEKNAKGKLTGRHQSRTNPHLTKKITKGPDKHGVYEGYWSQDGLEKKMPTTFVPDHWNLVDISNAVKEAYANPIEREKFLRPGVYEITGRSKSGVAFSILVDRTPDGDIMRTWYPIYNK